MNATKRKFNTLLNGIGSKPATSLAEKEVNNGSQNATTEQDAQAKKRRISDTLSERSQEPAAPKTVLSTLSATMKHKKSQSLATAPTEPPKYAPWDRTAFLKRLRSFSNLTDWTPKPARVNEVEWAKRGWECKKFERVRCNLCNVEILVKLNKKEVDGKEEPVYIAGNIGRTSVDEDDTDRSLTFDPEEALIDKYAELIINSHDEDCLWRKRGCDDTIFKLPLNHAPTTLHLLRERYEELCARKDTLPYSFNIKTPPGFDLDLILSYLPANFFTPLPTSSSEITPTTINRVAFTMALFGWQGHSHGRLGPQLGSVSCEACFRVLGLWLFKSKKVNESGEEVTPAVVPGLDVVVEHRTYCPWRNPESQNGTQATTKSSSALAGWEVILRVLKNEHRLRTGSAPSPPAKPRATRDSAEVVSQTSDDIDDDTAKSIRDEKDKERWARLRRVKSLFETKGKRLQREEKRKSRAE